MEMGDEPGTFDFRCDVHPIQMTGTLIAGYTRLTSAWRLRYIRRWAYPQSRSHTFGEDEK